MSKFKLVDKLFASFTVFEHVDTQQRTIVKKITVKKIIIKSSKIVEILYKLRLNDRLVSFANLVAMKDIKRDMAEVNNAITVNANIFPKQITLLLTGVTNRVAIVPLSFSPAITVDVALTHPAKSTDIKR